MRIALVRTWQPMPVDEIAHPLGIMSLDAYLRLHGHPDVSIFDMRLQRESPAAIAARVLATRPDVVGLSSLSIEQASMHAVAARIKRGAPGIVVVAGGPYASSSPGSAVADPDVDYAVVGEGEVTFCELLDALAAGRDPAGLPGVVCRRDDRLVEGPPRAVIADLDTLPFPSWDHIDVAGYERHDTVERFTGKPWASVSTSRGCPYGCTYCHDVFGRRFRPRSPSLVVDELEMLATRYGVREFHICDDLFNGDRQRVLDICRLIVQRGLKVHLQFPNGLRADRMDLEQLRALKEAGTFRVSYAIESASPRIQQETRKRLDIEKARTLIEETDRLGMLVHGFFMLGFPGETREEVLATRRFALRSRLHTAGFFLVTPFAGTPLARTAQAAGTLAPGDDQGFYDNPGGLAQVPGPEMKRIQRGTYLRFFLDPWRLARLWRLLPRRRVLLKFAWIYLRLATYRPGRADRAPASASGAHG